MKTVNFAILFLILTLNANAGWSPLYTLGYYGPTAYNLKKGVKYVELRVHSSSIESSGEYVKNSSFLKMYPYPPYDEDIFSRYPLVKKYAIPKAGISVPGWNTTYYYNAFMQDSTGKLWRLEDKRDLIDMIKPIDTPAEIRLVLWLDSKVYSAADGDKYKKSGSDYIIKSHYVITDVREGEGCGEYTYQYRVSRSGKLTKKRLSKKRVKVCSE